MKTNKEIAKEIILSYFEALASKDLLNADGFQEIMAIKFDDSIIEDKEQQKINDRQDVNMGVMSKVEYRSKWYAEDMNTAEKKVAEITANSPSVANYFSGLEE